MSAIEAIRKRIDAIDDEMGVHYRHIDLLNIRRHELTEVLKELGEIVPVVTLEKMMTELKHAAASTKHESPVMDKTVAEGREVKPPAVGKPRYVDEPKKTPTYLVLNLLFQHPGGLTTNQIRSRVPELSPKFSLTNILKKYTTMAWVVNCKVYTINQAGLNWLKNMPTESESGTTTTPART